MPISRKLEFTQPASTASFAFSNGQTFHGGKFFDAIGVDLQHLERAEDVISADVLDAWFDPSPRVLERIRDFLPFLSRTSPPVRAQGLLQTIARDRGVPEDCLLAAGGSSDLIFACFPHLLKSPGRALILDPMYGEYRYVLETVMGVDVRRLDLAKNNNFCIETDEFVAEVKETRPDLVVLVNPNSPTGQHWPRSQLISFLDSIPETVTVVVDETYIEYVGSLESVERDAAQRPNLLVIKSMSKVYALSGMRVGYLVGFPSSIAGLARWIPPWAVSLPAQLAAIEALQDPGYYEGRYRQTAALREELTSDLGGNPRIRVYPREQTSYWLRPRPVLKSLST